MKPQLRQQSASVAAALVAVTATPSIAMAYSWHETCGGSPVIWDQTFYMVRNAYSLPTNGSRHAMMTDMINRWRNVGAAQNIMAESFYSTSGSTVYLDDGINDVAFVAKEELEECYYNSNFQLECDSNAGTMFPETDGCWLPGDQEYVETDVWVTDDFGGTTGQPEPNIPGSAEGAGFLRHLMAHELGHAHGLGHYDWLNLMHDGSTMGNRFGRFGGDGDRIDVWPDDAQGLRVLYPAGGSETNIFATSQRAASNGYTTNNDGNITGSGTIAKCPGSSFTLTFTIGNNGTTQVSFAERYYLATSSVQWSGGGTTLATYNGVFNANALISFNHTFAMPNLPTGTYYVYHHVDYNGQVSESREDDNVARHPTRVEVLASCP